MPSIKDQSTVEAIAREFCSNGRNKGQALRTVGYAESSCISGHGIGVVYGSLRVKQAIARIDAKIEQKLDLSREGQHKKLEQAITMAIATDNPAALTGAVREQNEMLGYHRDKAPNTEKLAEMRDRMDVEEVEFRVEYAIKRCKVVSKGVEHEQRRATEALQGA